MKYWSVIFFISISFGVLGQHSVFNKADYLVNNGYYNLGFKEYEKKENIDSLKHVCYAGKGFCKFKLGDTTKAIEYFKKSIQLKPDYFEAKYQLGYIYQEQQKINEALKLYLEALDLVENDNLDQYRFRSLRAVYNNVGVIYFEYLDSVDLAIQYYNKAIILKPNYVDATKNRGKALLLQGNIKLAKVDLEKALDLGADEYFCNYYLLYVYLNLYEKKKMYNILEEGKIELENDYDFKTVGLAYFMNQDYKNLLHIIARLRWTY